jgi:hypothetical protein
MSQFHDDEKKSGIRPMRYGDPKDVSFLSYPEEWLKRPKNTIY